MCQRPYFLTADIVTTSPNGISSELYSASFPTASTAHLGQSQSYGAAHTFRFFPDYAPSQVVQFDMLIAPPAAAFNGVAGHQVLLLRWSHLRPGHCVALRSE